MTPHDLQLIFQAPFNYTLYSQEIVHRLFGCNDVEQQPYPIDTSAAGDLSHYVGHMEDSDGRLLGFFYTRVAEGSDVRRKRVGLRKLIQPYLRYEVDAAIAVFDDGQHWRLSYICDHKDNVTAAKRFSYILGDEKGQYKTPRERLEKVADMKGHFKLSDLKAAFSVETLSDEFFKEYHNHYDNIVSELARQGKTGAVFHDYVKKMMGRIVFLHFLQKKGWLNDNPAFLRDLFFFSPYQTDFLEQVLEPLFFGIFNTETEQRERLFDIEHWDKGLLKQWENLPYLNGGLFERDEVDKVHIKLPASLFEKLFEFMSSYNFTVDENDPDDADIGIDPEMLGKIFESLLEDNKSKGAFYTPKEIVRYMCKESLIAYLDSKLETDDASEKHNLNNPIQESKQLSQCGDADTKGGCVPEVRDLKQSIRDFVEQHELPEELDSYREVLDTALREVKICDPAIGSGAFPMGLLNELWRCREALIDAADTSERYDFNNPAQARGVATEGSNTCAQCGDSTAYNMRAGGTRPQTRAVLKKEIIENNIYGVDIERGAIDIARLRFWLSIVVDAEKPEPLPNFDYKFMQGNSLIESFDGHDLSHIMDKVIERNGKTYYQSKIGGKETVQVSMDFFSKDTRQNLRIWLKRYFSLTNHKDKSEYRKRINESVKSYIIQQGIGPSAEAKLDTLDPSANQDFFLWHTWFKDIFDNGGFDIVIGNPPYIQLQADGGRLADLYSNKGYKSFDRRGDIYELFYEKGNILLQAKGVLCFITSNGWMKSQYGDNLRSYLAQYTNPVLLVDFNQMRIFDNAIVETNILMFKKEQNMFRCKACSFLNHDKQTVLADLANQVDKECSICKFDRTGSWTIAEHSEQDVKYKIEALGILLSNWNVVIYRGITTGCNAGFIIDGTTRNWIYSKASQTERMLLDRTIYPILQGRNLKKYLYVFNDKYMIVTPKGYQIDKVPTLKKYMLTNYDSLSSKSGSNAWYELQASPSEKMLKNMHKEKILWGEISDKAKFTYDDGFFFAEATTFMMTTEDKNVSLRYLLAILNSKLSEWYFHKIATTTGMGTNRWKKYKLEQLPVVKPTKEQELQIVDLVNQIFEKKGVNQSADTSSLELEIDQQVYALYNLTPEEIAIIEQ